MAETLSMLSIISFIVAGVALAVAIFLWIFFKIPRVIGDLSGRNARKSIARVRASNEKSGNAARGKLTSTMPQTQPEQATEEIKPVGDMPETGLLAENRAKGTEESGTELLAKEEPTGVLFDENATEPLTDHPNGVKQHVVRGKKLQMIEEVILIHTDEVIE